ncbi:AraC family transcriptional regulator ligand-binding domain-containing protein [Nocardia sp. NPDC050712]|uniref:AraC family transcriptional regulator ligand-binding domain-containing protein n=1 Tax=Nocardia sp. NPDC050712 TaxID=3155518 RepID=UPI0033F0D963
MTTDIALLPKAILDGAGLTDQARGRLAAEAGLPGWALASPTTTVSGRVHLRLWELIEYEFDDPGMALRIADTYVPGQMGVHDYLIATAPTWGAGLARSRPFLSTITSNFAFALVEEDADDDEVSIDIELLDGHGRGRELAMQYAAAANTVRARHITGQRICPSRIMFRQRAPKTHRHFAELFGTVNVDFGAPSDRLTFRAADLSLPLRTADPMLAAVMSHYAEGLAAPAPRATTWTEEVHRQLVALLPAGGATVDLVARRMLTSRRSLQRRLAEEGTTWTAELDKARRIELQRSAPAVSTTELARRLGYSDSRALRRALRRLLP